MFTTETAVEAVCVKLTRFMPTTPSVETFAKPVTPDVASAAPQPSQRQPGEVESLPVGRNSRPTSPSPAAEPVPSVELRSPSGRTARRTVPLSIHTAGAHGGETATCTVAVEVNSPSLAV